LYFKVKFNYNFINVDVFKLKSEKNEIGEKRKSGVSKRNIKFKSRGGRGGNPLDEEKPGWVQTPKTRGFLYYCQQPPATSQPQPPVNSQAKSQEPSTIQINPNNNPNRIQTIAKP